MSRLSGDASARRRNGDAIGNVDGDATGGETFAGHKSGRYFARGVVV
jgi:hypothetical protein